MKNQNRFVQRALACLLCAALILAALPTAFADGEWICPGCGRVNSERMNFCGGCRTKKPDPAAPEISGHPNAWICSSCGNVAPSEDSFCTNCGADHHDMDTPAMLVPETQLDLISFEPCYVQRTGASFSTRGQSNTERFTVPVTGVYSIWLEDKMADMSFQLSVSDSAGTKLYSSSSSIKNPGCSLELTAGQVCTVSLTLNSPASGGSYTMCLGMPRDPQPIGESKLIADAFTFKSQRNTYLFTPEVSGYYGVRLTEVHSGQKMRLKIIDSLGYELAGNTNASGRGLHIGAELKAGETYRIRAMQESEIGEYTLQVGWAKPVIDISGCSAVGDSVYFDSQTNRYMFTPAETGTYELSVGFAESGVRFKAYVYDINGYKMGGHDSIYFGSSAFNVKLEAGKPYEIRFTQKENYGWYALRIVRRADK